MARDHRHAVTGHEHSEHDIGGHDHGDHRDHDESGHHNDRWWRRIVPLPLGGAHSHDPADHMDDTMVENRRGIRTVQVSLALLVATAAVEAAIVAMSGSIALLGDTLHNAADALTALPLWVAFRLGAREPTDRYTYGFGRAEDLAAVFIVVVMIGSSVAAAWASVLRLVHPHPVHRLPVVAAAAAVGFVGNELVAAYRIRTGRSIGSAALVADGLHARTDGLTSLAVLAGVIGVWLGLASADPIVGLIVTVVILRVVLRAGRDVYRRLMDAVDPALVSSGREVLEAVPGVVAVTSLQIRWIGHRLLADATVVVDPASTVVTGHQVSEEASHALLHQIPRLSAARLHVDPAQWSDSDHHSLTAHHRTGDPPATPLTSEIDP